MDTRLDRINKAVEFLNARTGNFRPVAGIVLGSGLGKLAESIENQIVVPYSTIPDFPRSTAIGHKGNFIFGTLGGKNVIAMQGRFHYYEGYSMDLVTIGIRVMKTLGIKYLFVSNAAGACNPDYKVGDLVIIKDHINTLPNPLIGPNLAEFGPRFVDMTCAYDQELQDMADKIGEEMGLRLFHGVYFGSTGPTFETPAEIRFYRTVGADLVGMSTIPEVIVARHCDIRVFGMSVATNISNFTNTPHNLNDSEDVIVQADSAAEKMSAIFRELIKRID